MEGYALFKTVSRREVFTACFKQSISFYTASAISVALMRELNLPEPSADEKQHSQNMVKLVCDEITSTGGWIDFARYMELALYAPGLGYYSSGAQKFGEQGDFITAPEISSLFAQTLANPVSQILQSMGGGDVLEFGAGSGIFAADLLQELKNKKSLPEHYFILELSGELKLRQKQTLEKYVPELIDRVIWLDSLPQKPVKAVVLANEVLDAMPVQRFVKSEAGIEQMGVTCVDGSLVLQNKKASDELNLRVQNIEKETGNEFLSGYTSEINLNINPWLQSISEILDQGAVYLIDYGYPRLEFYLPERFMGTLMCYYKHRAQGDALWNPGLQDLTAFVDFTAVAEAAVDAGFDVNGFTSQANFLLNTGLAQLVESKMSDDLKKQLPLVQQMKTLTLPSEMGERFKVMGLNKGLDILTPGFELRDARERL
jgi:SAM-dependent MidA family methyltransferase